MHKRYFFILFLALLPYAYCKAFFVAASRIQLRNFQENNKELNLAPTSQPENEKICVLDSFTIDQGDIGMWKKLETFCGKEFQLKIFPRTNAAEIIARISGATALFSSKVSITEKEMLSCPNLKYIGVLATGYNMVDLNCARERGIAVTNVPGYSSSSVAQMVFSYILHDYVGLESHLQGVRLGQWQDSPDFCYFNYQMRELYGKTILLVGSGDIGSEVGKIAAAFGMKVIYAQLPGRNSAKKQPFDCEYLPLEAGLKVADVISLHCPLTSQTEKLVNSNFLSLVKKNALLINTGRGTLIDEQAVCQGLDDGILRGAYCDVLKTEPPVASKLCDHPKSFVTPHIAWGSLESRQRLVNVVVENFHSYLSGTKMNRLV